MINRKEGLRPLSVDLFEAYGNTVAVMEVPTGYLILQDHLLSFSPERPVFTEVENHRPGNPWVWKIVLEYSRDHIQGLFDQPNRRFWDLRRREYQD